MEMSSSSILTVNMWDGVNLPPSLQGATAHVDNRLENFTDEELEAAAALARSLESLEALWELGPPSFPRQQSQGFIACFHLLAWNGELCEDCGSDPFGIVGTVILEHVGTSRGPRRVELVARTTNLPSPPKLVSAH